MIRMTSSPSIMAAIIRCSKDVSLRNSTETLIEYNAWIMCAKCETNVGTWYTSDSRVK